MASRGFDHDIQSAKRVVDEVVTALETNFTGFNISEIIKAGSLGHGTAVPGNFDIDLVIYSRDISGEGLRRHGYTPYLQQLNSFLRSNLGVVGSMTGRAVQFTYKGIDIDLLVSPYWRNQHELYRFLQTVPKPERGDYTVCASKWQVEFFKAQPSAVKEYAKKAKDWRNEMWPKDEGGEGKPSSYLMSLLVVAAYQRKGAYGSVTQALKSLVKNSHSLDIYWADNPDDFYNRRDYSNLLPGRPRIVDPANPANNVWESGIKSYRRGEKQSDYEGGDGNTSVLQRYIDTINIG